MLVLVTSKSDVDSIKNEHATLVLPFSHYKSKGIFFLRKGHQTGKGVVRPGRNSKLSEILCLSS